MIDLSRNNLYAIGPALSQLNDSPSCRGKNIALLSNPLPLPPHFALGEAMSPVTLTRGDWAPPLLVWQQSPIDTLVLRRSSPTGYRSSNNHRMEYGT